MMLPVKNTGKGVGVFNCCKVFRQLQNLTAATIPLQIPKKKNPGYQARVIPV
jgi:hypothetical protein